MHQQLIDKGSRGAIVAMMPTRDDINSVAEGVEAPDCFGNMRRVTSVFARGVNDYGAAYVCYHTEFGATSTISMSMTENEMVRTTRLSHLCNSAECDRIEAAWRTRLGLTCNWRVW